MKTYKLNEHLIEHAFHLRKHTNQPIRALFLMFNYLYLKYVKVYVQHITTLLLSNIQTPINSTNE